MKIDSKFIFDSNKKLIHCHKCKNAFYVELDFIGGKSFKCPDCGHPIIVEQHGGHCWKYDSDLYDPDDPCDGVINVVEYYPGHYVYFCDHHGFWEDEEID